MPTLILLRHGQSEWNLADLFTGWVDVDLTDLGVLEGVAAGELLLLEGIAPDVLHTSLQKRAIRTAELALRALDRSWIPVRRSWRLNERHYGALQGLDKKATTDKYGKDQVKIWRRAYATPPPRARRGGAAPSRPEIRGTRTSRPTCCPRRNASPTSSTACCRTGTTTSSPTSTPAESVLVAAHGNSLRALVKHLDGMSDDDIVELNIPTGIPLVYELDADLQAHRAPATSATPRPRRRPRKRSPSKRADTHSRQAVADDDNARSPDRGPHRRRRSALRHPCPTARSSRSSRCSEREGLWIVQNDLPGRVRGADAPPHRPGLGLHRVGRVEVQGVRLREPRRFVPLRAGRTRCTRSSASRTTPTCGSTCTART